MTRSQGPVTFVGIDSRDWVANLHQGVLDQSWSFRSQSALPSRPLLLAGSSLIQGSCRQLSPSGFCKVGVDTGIVHMSFGSWIPHSCSAGRCLCSAEPPPAPKCSPVAAISGSECAYCSCGLVAPLWTPPGYTDSSKTPLPIGQVRFSSTSLVNRLHHTSCHLGNTGSSKWWGHVPFYRASTPRHLRSVPLRRCSKYPILLVIPRLSLAS